jgi:dCMP deaminase
MIKDDRVSKVELETLDHLDVLANELSNCSVRRYAAALIGPLGLIRSAGGNRTPVGMARCGEGGCLRAEHEATPGVDHSDCVSMHAEAKALMGCAPDLRVDATLVVTGPPCFECAKLVAGSDVKRIVFRHANGYTELPKVLKFFHDAGVTVEMVYRN